MKTADTTERIPADDAYVTGLDYAKREGLNSYTERIKRLAADAKRRGAIVGGTGTGGANGFGGGGGGGSPDASSGSAAGAGGSGVVIIRYPTASTSVLGTGGNISTVGAYTYHTFLTSGTFVVPIGAFAGDGPVFF